MSSVYLETSAALAWLLGEPVRTLDAIHLATALEFLKILPATCVLSLDQRILSNLVPLGLSSVEGDAPQSP